MVQTIKLVYSNFKYVALASAIFVPMMIGLLILSEYIFLEPYVVAHLPSGSEFGFVLIVILSALSALVIPMNIFRINILKSSTSNLVTNPQCVHETISIKSISGKIIERDAAPQTDMFSCTHCGFVTRFEVELNVHMRIHYL